jgi:glycosyltransferase involved in cell wall biosynthesis
MLEYKEGAREKLSAGPVKVVLIINSLNAGGAERTLMHIATNLEGRYEPKILCLHEAGAYYQDVASRVESSVLGLKHRVRAAEVGALTAFLKYERPTIVHTFLRNANRWGTVAARLAGVPVTVNSLQNMYYDEGSIRLQADRLLVRGATAAVSCSEAVREFFIESKGFPAHKIRTIYNAVELSDFRERCNQSYLHELLNVQKRARFIGTIGSLIEQKGHTFLLQAFARLSARRDDLKLVLVGEGDLTTALRKQAEALGIVENVRFLGMRRDVERILGALDVFVMPSLWEGFPVALLEAMASEVPVVASSVGGIPEILLDGRNGVLVPAGDPALLAEAMEALIDDESLRSTLGRAGRASVEKNFSVEMMISAYIELYESCLVSTSAERSGA